MEENVNKASDKFLELVADNPRAALNVFLFMFVCILTGTVFTIFSRGDNREADLIKKHEAEKKTWEVKEDSLIRERYRVESEGLILRISEKDTLIAVISELNAKLNQKTPEIERKTNTLNYNSLQSRKNSTKVNNKVKLLKRIQENEN